MRKAPLGSLIATAHNLGKGLAGGVVKVGAVTLGG
jgi:hypothetical protein